MDYLGQALNAYQNNKPFRHLLKMHHREELLYYKKIEVEGVKILSVGEDNACEKCQKQNGKRYTINQALEIMPLPTKACKMDLYENGNIGYCRCVYLPITNMEDV